MLGARRSSASRTRMWVPVARSTPAFLARAKSSHQGKCTTMAPSASAIATVSSVDPVSTTIISWTTPRTDRRQPARKPASFFAIMHREMRVRVFMGIPCQRTGGDSTKKPPRRGSAPGGLWG